MMRSDGSENKLTWDTGQSQRAEKHRDAGVIQGGGGGVMILGHKHVCPKR